MPQGTAYDGAVAYDGALPYDLETIISSTGHGKTVGVPNIGHLAPVAADAIRKWLAEQEAKADRRRLSVEAERTRRQAVIDRYSRLLTQPRTHTLRGTTRVSPTTAATFAFHPAPAPITLSIPTAAHVSPRFAVDVLIPSVHNVSIATVARVSSVPRMVFVDIARIRRQDESVLSALLARIMMED